MISDVNVLAQVDSIGKLREWLAECGIPQRSYEPHELASKSEDIEQWYLGAKFVAGDAELATEAHKRLIEFAARAMCGRFMSMPDIRIVWRIRPEVAETRVCEYRDKAGNKIDPLVYRGALSDLKTIYTGERAATFYCRFWTEKI